MTVADQVKKAVETFTGVVFTVTTSTVYADGGYEFIFVNKRPIVSIGAIVDTQPVTPTTTTASAYDFFPERGSIYLKSGASWSPGQRRKWKITLDHGYAAVPDDVQLAIDTWVAAIGDNPSGGPPAK